MNNVGKLHVKHASSSFQLHYHTSISSGNVSVTTKGALFWTVMCVCACCEPSLLKTIAPDCTADQKGWVHTTRVEKQGRGKEGGKEAGRQGKKLNGGMNE